MSTPWRGLQSSEDHTMPLASCSRSSWASAPTSREHVRLEMFLTLSVTPTACLEATVAVSAVAMSSISSSEQGPFAADVTNEKGVGLGVGEAVGTNGCGGSLEVRVGSGEFVAARFCAPLLDGPLQA